MKLRIIVAQLLEEVEGLTVVSDALEETKSQLEEKEIILKTKETKLIQRESNYLDKNRELTKREKSLNELATKTEIKQIKLHKEWAKMVDDRQVLSSKIDANKRKSLQLENKEKLLVQKDKDHDEKTNTDSEIFAKKYKALDKLNKSLNIKKQMTDEKAKRVDEAYSQV